MKAVKSKKEKPNQPETSAESLDKKLERLGKQLTDAGFNSAVIPLTRDQGIEVLKRLATRDHLTLKRWFHSVRQGSKLGSFDGHLDLELLDSDNHVRFDDDHEEHLATVRFTLDPSKSFSYAQNGDGEFSLHIGDSISLHAS